MNKRILSSAAFILAACLLTCLCGPAPSNEEAIASAAASIRPEALRAHAEFLADDALEGRGTGTRGHDLAVKYLRSQFAALGLKGGAGEGSYFQKVPFLRAKVDEASARLVFQEEASSRELAHGLDYVLIDTEASPEIDASGPIVFAGFGVTAEDLDYDDYANLDVTDKVVAILKGAPAYFPATLRAYYSEHDVKRRNAAARGAVGIIEVRTPAEEKRAPWPLWVDSWAVSGRWIDEGGRPHGLDDQVRFWAVLNLSGGEALFAGESHSFEEVSQATASPAKVPSFALKKTVAVRFKSRLVPGESANVAALLEGADAKLKNEFIVLTSHVDHLGIGRPIEGDAIYNGAWDNAAGCGVLVEVARACVEAGGRPKRSILFLITTGEEAGFLGSSCFVHHPTVPAAGIAANINVDGGGASLIPISDVVLYGEEHTTLGPVARRAAAAAGLEVTPDPWPEEVMFARQDAFPFILRGIPALYVDSGIKSIDPSVDGLAVLKKWFATIYHSPKDDMLQRLDFEYGARFSRFVFRLCLAVADGPDRPKWNEGDFFGRTFGRPD